MNEYKVRFIPIGGIVGVTKNMYVYELYKDDQLQDILVVDSGIGFPDASELGVDFVIPDVSYLQDKKDKIRALLITHAHEDHIGAIPYIYAKIGSPPILASKLTTVFITNKCKEHNVKIDLHEIEYRKDYQLGEFVVRYIRMTHSIPDATHILIKSPVGSLYHGPDYKLDLTPPYGNGPDFYEITKAGNDGILCLLSDSLGSEREGLTLSESIVGETFEDEMRKTKGKFFMTTFSSNISRIRQCVEAAIKFNRKIIFLGRSMKQNTIAAGEIGYLPIPYSLMGKEEEISQLAPNKVCIIAAGSQGQFGSALSKIAHKRNANIKIKPGDKVIFSSDPIPGNEGEVSAIIEELALQGAEVVYSAIHDALHTSGHGNQEDMKFLARFTNPQYFIPIGGTIRHNKQYQKLISAMGFKKEHIFTPDEGDTVWFTKNKAYLGEKVETRNVYIDAYGVGDVGTVVLRDRQTLSSEGIVVIVLPMNVQLQLVAQPRILSRGFVFEKGENKLFDEAIKKTEKVLGTSTNIQADTAHLKREVIKEMEGYFFEARGRKPLIMVEIIQM